MENKTLFTKKFNVLLFALILSQSLISIAQQQYDIRTPKFQRVENAYAYLIQMDNYFDLLLNNYPSLSLEIEVSENLFTNSYGKAKVKMREYLISFYGIEKLQNFEKDFSDVLTENSSSMLSEMSTEYSARQVLDILDKRSKGNIPPDELKTILSFQFIDNPLLEFTKGYKYTYKTKNHSKSKGTDWQLEIPLSWKAEEGDRPNIIQKFTNDCGDGFQIIMLMVQNLPPENCNLTDDQIELLREESAIKSMIPKNSEFISYTKISIESYKGGMIIFESIKTRLDLTIKMRCCMFFFLTDDMMYQIMCMVSSDDNKKDLSKEMDISLPLFKSVVNTIVINNKYH